MVSPSEKLALLTTWQPPPSLCLLSHACNASLERSPTSGRCELAASRQQRCRGLAATGWASSCHLSGVPSPKDPWTTEVIGRSKVPGTPPSPCTTDHHHQVTVIFSLYRRSSSFSIPGIPVSRGKMLNYSVALLGRARTPLVSSWLFN